jgi:hypothetical protein
MNAGVDGVLEWSFYAAQSRVEGFLRDEGPSRNKSLTDSLKIAVSSYSWMMTLYVQNIYVSTVNLRNVSFFEKQAVHHDSF